MAHFVHKWFAAELIPGGAQGLTRLGFTPKAQWSLCYGDALSVTHRGGFGWMALCEAAASVVLGLSKPVLIANSAAPANPARCKKALRN